MLFPSRISSSESIGLTEDERITVKQMVQQWKKHLHGNRRRQEIYDQKNLFHDLRISTPPQLRDLGPVLGWGARAVDSVADRVIFERFATFDSDNDFGLSDIATDNDFRVEFSQATVSALTQSCSFITVSQGLDGEPETLWTTRSAEQATGVWDRRRRGLSAGMTVTPNHTTGEPERIVVYFPYKTVDITISGGRYYSTVMQNNTGRLPMEVIRFRPDLRRPFGRSRITPTVEYCIMGGVRTMVRSEVGAEFFAAPQRYGIGLSDKDFQIDRWTAVMGRYLTVEKDEDGDLPQLGQFSQHSMVPHMDHLRMWAAQMSGESSVPMSELGFVSDNPSSDAAIQSQREPLRMIADDMVRVSTGALRRLAVTTVMIQDDVSEPPEGTEQIQVKFAPTFRPSDSGASDAVLKQISALPWLADSPVILEKLNYSADDIERLLSDKKRGEAREALNELLHRQRQDSERQLPQAESVGGSENDDTG